MQLSKLSCLAVTASLLLAGQCFAQQPRTDQQNSLERETGREAEKMEELPEFLTKLDLTDQQEQQLREVMRTHNQKMENVWAEFHRLHWLTVEFEASLAAANALEGHNHADHHPGDSGNQAEKRQPNQRENEANRNQQDDQRNAARSTENRPQSNPRHGAARDQNPSTQANRPEAKDRETAESDDEESDINILSMRVAVLDPKGVVREIQLPGNIPRHETKCEICAAHEKELKTLWGKVHKLHGQLVQIEAERMIAIESKLTEEQLKQLQDEKAPRETESKDRSPEQTEAANTRRQNETRKE